MRYLILLPVLLLCSCKQTEVLRDNVEKTNHRVNKLVYVLQDSLKRAYEANPQDVDAAVAYNDIENLANDPLPTQINLPPVVPPQVVQGGLGLLGMTGLGGSGLMTVLATMLGVAYKKHKGHAKELVSKDREESQEYAKAKGLV